MENVKQLVLHVDPVTGCDENDGILSPIRSLLGVKKILSSLSERCEVTVYFEKGVYPFSQNVEIDYAALPNAPLSLLLKGHKDGTVFSANRKLDGMRFENVPGSPSYVYRFEKQADGTYPAFREVYVDNVRAPRSHRGFLRTYDAEILGRDVYRTPYNFDGVDGGADFDRLDKEGYKLYLHRELLEGVTEKDCATLELNVSLAWYFRILHIERVDFEDVKEDFVAVYLKGEEVRPLARMHGWSHHLYWLENALPLLETPGEYFYDRHEGLLYYYPKDPAELEKISIGETGHMLSFLGAEGVTVEDITFRCNDNPFLIENFFADGQAKTSDSEYGSECLAALFFRDAKNTAIRRCAFLEMGTSAVKFCGVTKGLDILDSTFRNLACSAMDIGYRSGWNPGVSTNENIRVLGNTVDNVAVTTRGSDALIVTAAKEVEIAHNTFRNTSYTCISVGWRWTPGDWKFGDNWHLYHADIHHNYFLDFMTDQSDGGPIYTLGGNAENGYHEYFNYMHDNFAFYTKKCWNREGMIMPYYHDGGSSNWHTYRNVQIQYPERPVHASIYLQNIPEQYAHNILVEDNETVAPLKTAEMIKSGRAITEPEKEMLLFGGDWSRPAVDGLLPSRVDRGRDLYQKNNPLVDEPIAMSPEARRIASLAGAPGAMPDVEAIIKEMQPIYEAYYEKVKNS